MIWLSIVTILMVVVTIVTVLSAHRHINTLWVFGPFYWILRDTEYSNKLRFPIRLGFMRQTTPPWRIGYGVQVKVHKYFYQFGVCRKPKNVDDTNGLLYAVKGRILETPIKEIGEWQ